METYNNKYSLNIIYFLPACNIFSFKLYSRTHSHTHTHTYTRTHTRTQPQTEKHTNRHTHIHERTHKCVCAPAARRCVTFNQCFSSPKMRVHSRYPECGEKYGLIAKMYTKIFLKRLAISEKYGFGPKLRISGVMH